MGGAVAVGGADALALGTGGVADAVGAADAELSGDADAEADGAGGSTTTVCVFGSQLASTASAKPSATTRPREQNGHAASSARRSRWQRVQGTMLRDYMTPVDLVPRMSYP